VKTIVYIGTSLDGFIARKDGELHWLEQFANEEAMKSYEELTTRIDAIIAPPASGDLRIVLQRRNAHDKPSRVFFKEKMGDFFMIEAWQDGHPLPVAMNYDRVIWSGLAWAVGEIRHRDIEPGKPIELRLSTPDQDPSIHLIGQVYSVEY